MLHNYCTILSNDSLYKGLVLYHSLKEYDDNFTLYMICMQDNVKSILEAMKLDNVVIISLKDIEDFDKALASAKNTRNEKEYAWTIKSSIILYLFDKYFSLQNMIYIDADIEFFSSVEPIFEEFKDASIMLTRERFYIQDNEPWYIQYGQYNGGFMAFKRDDNGIEALYWLREKCINWCYNKVEKQLYGDQKYTEDWLQRFKGVKISKNLGINTTAWYAHACFLEEKDSKVYINDNPIIFYHYNGLSMYNDSEFDLCVFINLPKKLINMIYIPYLKKLQDSSKLIASFDSSFYEKTIKPTSNQYIKNYYKLNTIPAIKKYNFCTLMGKDYLIKGLAMYNSIKNYQKDFHLWICCMDDYSMNALKTMNLNNVTLIPVSNVEDSELLSVKSQRSPSEYCWTIKSSWILYLLKTYEDIPSIIFLDGDLFFFSECSPIFNEFKEDSVLLCPQYDKEWVEEQFGKYQAGLIGFKNDANALQCLSWWRERCLEWCSSEQGLQDRWGDQKYLDKLPELFNGIKINTHLGIDASVWNAKNNINLDLSNVYIKDFELIAYHFCCLTIFSENEFDLWRWPNWFVDSKMVEFIYKPYIKALRDAMKELSSKSIDPGTLIIPEYDKSRAANHYRFSE